MMGRYKELQKQYEELNKKYIAMFAEKSELEYKLEELKKEHELITKQDGEIRSLHQNARKLKHDMKNHLMVIASYINDMDYEKAKQYASDILDKFNGMHSYVETGNALMNHILNEKLQYARSQGILVKAEIENLAFARMKSIDFSALLSNMLDNAIEASLREATGAAREIHIAITQCKGYDTIGVKNRVSKSVLAENPGLVSVKAEKNNHGLGIVQIKSIVDEYQGMSDFYEEEGFFCVKVFIPQ